MVGEGDLAPDLTIDTGAGAAIALRHPPRALVLYFYPKDDTSGCTREAQDFSALLGDFTAAGADVVGVSRDDAASHAKFRTKHGLTVPLATDAGALSAAFGTWVEKAMYGRRYMGMERATFLVDTGGNIARAWRKVRVPGHAAAVLAAVRALGTA